MTDVTLLDGSIGQEIVRRSGRPPTPLWSTRVMIDQPEIVTDVHRAYLSAGATVLSTNTYATHVSRLESVGMAGQLPDLVKAAVAAAHDARGESDASIAGCLGPLLASYRPDLAPDEALAEARYAQLARLMAPHVDLFLLETVSSLQEARGALRGLRGHGVPIWLSLTVQDTDGTRLRSSEPLGDCLGLLDGVQAVLVNCSRPEVIADALPILGDSGLPFGAYANGFTHISDAFLTDRPTVDVLSARVDLGPERYADFALDWVRLGARIVGGCCEVGPAHIAALARRLVADGYRIVRPAV